jgi:hypothetical protein
VVLLRESKRRARQNEEYAGAITMMSSNRHKRSAYFEGPLATSGGRKNRTYARSGTHL